MGNGVLEMSFRGFAFELGMLEFRGEEEQEGRRRWDIGALEAPMFNWFGSKAKLGLLPLYRSNCVARPRGKLFPSSLTALFLSVLYVIFLNYFF